MPDKGQEPNRSPSATPNDRVQTSDSRRRTWAEIAARSTRRHQALEHETLETRSRGHPAEPANVESTAAVPEDEVEAQELTAAQMASVRETGLGGAGPSTNPLGTQHPLSTQLDGSVPSAPEIVSPSSAEATWPFAQEYMQAVRRTHSLPAAQSPRASIYAYLQAQENEHEAQPPTIDDTTSSELTSAFSSYPHLQNLQLQRLPVMGTLPTIEDVLEVPPTPAPTDVETGALHRTSPGGTQHPIQPPSYPDLSEALRQATADSLQPSPRSSVGGPTHEAGTQPSSSDSGAEADSERSDPMSNESQEAADQGEAINTKQTQPRDEAHGESSEPSQGQRLSGGPIPHIGMNWIPEQTAAGPAESHNATTTTTARLSGGPIPHIGDRWIGPAHAEDSNSQLPSSSSAARSISFGNPPANNENSVGDEDPGTDPATIGEGVPGPSRRPQRPRLHQRSSSSWIHVNDQEDYSDVSMSFRLNHHGPANQDFLQRARQASCEEGVSLCQVHSSEDESEEDAGTHILRDLWDRLRQRAIR